MGLKILFILFMSNHGYASNYFDFNQKLSTFNQCFEIKFCGNSKINLEVSPTDSLQKKKEKFFKTVAEECQVLTPDSRTQFLDKGDSSTFFYYFTKDSRTILNHISCSPHRSFEAITTFFSAKNNLARVNKQLELEGIFDEAFTCYDEADDENGFGRLAGFGLIKNPMTQQCERICQEGTTFQIQPKMGFEDYSIQDRINIFNIKTNNSIRYGKFHDYFEAVCSNCPIDYPNTKPISNTCYDLDSTCVEGKENVLDRGCQPLCEVFEKRDAEGTCVKNLKLFCEYLQEQRESFLNWNPLQDLMGFSYKSCAATDYERAAQVYRTLSIEKLDYDFKLCNSSANEETKLEAVQKSFKAGNFGFSLNTFSRTFNLDCRLSGDEIPDYLNTLPRFLTETEK